jgi:hypothetical protein
MRFPRRWLSYGLMLGIGSWGYGESPRPAQEPISPRSPLKPQTSPSPRPSVPPAASSPAPARLPDSITKPQETNSIRIDRPKFMTIDPNVVEVRRNGKSWELWAGKTRLKDFGDDRRAAYEARRLIAELQLTEYAAIGTHATVMEVWLSNGQAPPLPAFSRNIIPFDPDSLRVIDDRGTYLVGNERQILFNFGPYEADAHQAVALIQQHGFNELGFLGEPNPKLTYFLKNTTSRRLIASSASRFPQTAAQLTPRQVLEIPGLGRIGERFPIDPIKLELRKQADGWHLISGSFDLGNVGSHEYQARTALQIVQRFPLTEQIRTGKDAFVFYLSHGAAPRGAPIGARRVPLATDTLTVKPLGATAVLTDGRHLVGTFPSVEEAQRVLSIMKHYEMNCICEIGPGLRVYVKD